jgi:hypothetical protein
MSITCIIVCYNCYVNLLLRWYWFLLSKKMKTYNFHRPTIAEGS